jgi:hypothetical protein
MDTQVGLATGGVVQVVESLPSKRKAPSSIHSTAKEKQKDTLFSIAI